MMNCRLSFLLSAGALAFGAFAGEAPLEIVTPEKGACISLLPKEYAAYFALPDAERRARFADKESRAAYSKVPPVPGRVRFSWRGSDKGRLTVRRLGAESGVVFEKTVTNGFELVNLETGRQYGYELKSRDGRRVEGRFETADEAPRMIDWPGIPNVRDLGGWKGLDGRRVRQGLAYRSAGLNENATWKWVTADELAKAIDAGGDALEKLLATTCSSTLQPTDVGKYAEKLRKARGKDGKGLARYEKRFAVRDGMAPGRKRLNRETRRFGASGETGCLGIRTDIDLRAKRECFGMKGSPLGETVRWVHIPSQSYAGMGSEAGRAQFRKVLEVFLDEANYPLDFHCIGGADRTGAVAFIVNALLGVSLEDLSKDWEATGLRLKRAESWCHKDYYDKLVRVFDRYPGKTINERVEGYVLSLGFAKKDIEKLRQILLEPKTVAKSGRPTALDELMPQPVRVEPREGAVCAKERLAGPKTVEGPVPGAPELTADEAYVLDITPEGATITASSRRGFIWARQTLAQLAKLARGKSVPCCRIVDWPHLKWRGFMLDTARNYLPVDSLKDVIDGMAAYKLNLFHWHLTENYAWRLESKRHPELQSERAFVLRHKGKYYTQAEFREIADYAWERGVSLMPEFDFPGHCHAFRLAFGLKSMDDPRAEKLAVDLFDELCGLVPAEKMPFVHMGTDEVYKRELEGMSPEALSRIAKALNDRGRTVVSWVPGEAYPCEGPHVNMFWTRDVSFKKTPGPYFDAYGMYIESRDPFELTPHAAYWQAATRWERPGRNNLGALFCAWHDGFVGEDYDNLIRNQQVFSSCVLFGDAFWHGRETHRSEFRIRMPLADDPLLAVAAELERRVAAQRDRCFADSRHPFHFLRQSDMRWRLTQEDGTPIVRGVAQATISPDLGYVPASNGTVIAETWIRSPAEQDVGAWIGFTKISRDHGFVSSAPTPARGEWNRFGARVELNGAAIPPPEWKQPSVQLGKPIGEWTSAWTLYEADEVPFTDQEYFMREPTPIHLRKGWNHVRLVSPNPQARGKTKHRWGATFIPLLGTTEHPREVPGLEYSDEPPADDVEPLPPLPEGGFTYCVIPDTQRYLGVGVYVKKGRKPSVPTDGPTRNPAFESRVDWIVRNLERERIFFVSHTGDIVDFKNREQWNFASNLMTRLEGRVPFGISPGNHDVSSGDSTLFNMWFPRSRFEKYPWYAGAFERPPSKSGHYISGGNANSCQLAEIDGHRFVFLHLECNAPADVLKWAGEMMDRYADRIAVVCTHMCVGFKTEAFNREQSGKPDVKPEWFGVMDWSKCHGERGVSGEEAWRTCFSRHPNLVLVVSGDQSSAVTARETRKGVHGNTVHLTLQDYPRKSDDDDWLRLYRFRKDMSAIDVLTYSPRRGTVCQTAGRLHGRDLHVFTLPLDARWWNPPR